MAKTIKKIGMLGGGQLGRMAALAAANLGIKVIPYDPNPDSPAFQVCEKHFCADWDNTAQLKDFADSVDVITYEFENIPLETILTLEEFGVDVWPGKDLLAMAQHRVKEKTTLQENGIPTTDFYPFQSAEQLSEVMNEWACDKVVLKTCRFGYDGKGQLFYNKGEALPDFIDQEVIIERLVDFDLEISVVVARDLAGTVKSYCPVKNDHQNHILHKTTAPAPLADELSEQARQYAEKLARTLSLVGVMAIEFFVTKDGKLLANEIAPRPHNSGHWTIDACYCSQFEQQIRAIAGLPLGSAQAHSKAHMVNLLGEDINNLGDYLNNSRACLHDYGKADIRAGRKMGHVTILED